MDVRKTFWLLVLLPIAGCGGSSATVAPATPEDEKAAEQRIRDEAARERKARQEQKRQKPNPDDK